MEATLTNPKAATRTRNAWVRSPAWDGFWIFSALWLAPIVWWTSRGPDHPRESDFYWVYLVLTLLFWIGHRVSSTYLAYCTSAYRPLLTSQRVRFVWVPLGIVVLTFGLLLPGDDALPWTRAQRILTLAILDYVFVTYHFASQHFGFLSLYGLRGGRPRANNARRWDRAYALVVGGGMVIVAELITGQIFFKDVWIDPIIDPAWLEANYGLLRWSGSAFVAIATAWMFLRERQSLPRALYLLCMATLVVAAFFIHPFLFIALWSAQHWLAAMGLTTVVAQGDRPGPGSRNRWYRAWSAVSRRRWTLALVLVAASALLLPIMEVESMEGGQLGFAENIVPAFSAALTNSTWVPALIALGFVTAFLHYALDRAVFRLSDREVRGAASNLLDKGA
ncbi:MAG: hypothetical protein ACYTGZ_04175 [Planctomycetota bacterium]